jgi:aspartyl-tRNA(Asn)/glutamyl-tRNA(Gln) amidotransferase subunit A
MRLWPGPQETIAGWAAQIAEGRRSCADVLEHCLEAAEAREAEVRAWVVLDRDGARAQARRLDDELAGGHRRGPLHGIPLGVKDIIDVAGLPTAAGSVLWADRIADADAEVVALLRHAGANVLGKTVTTAYAWIDPPPTRNPWDPGRTPGGSSSGSAAALASGMCLAALGSQTGGSILRPASYCGVAGLKPTYGRLGGSGVFPLAPSLDHPGPLARTARDLALIWRALRPDDPPAELSVRPPRLARLGGLFDERAEPAALAALDAALAALAEAGAPVVDRPLLPPGFAGALLQHRQILAAEAASVHQPRRSLVPDDYPGRISGLIDEGMVVRATAYIFARNHQERLRRDVLDLFDAADALATLAAPGPAPEASTTGDPAFNSPWSYTGLPTVAIPAALAPDGLPLGLQLVGKPGAEAELLGVAMWCERVLAGAPGG